MRSTAKLSILLTSFRSRVASQNPLPLGAVGTHSRLAAKDWFEAQYILAATFRDRSKSASSVVSRIGQRAGLCPSATGDRLSRHRGHDS